MRAIFTFLGLTFTLFAVGQTKHIIEVASNSYTPKELTIAVGDTVEFQWVSGNHPTLSDNGDFEEFPMNINDTVKVLVFNEEKLIPYYCRRHGNVGGVGMSGVLTVGNPTTSIRDFDESPYEVQVYPNATLDQVTVKYFLPENEQVQIRLVDITGKTVSKTTKQALSAGNQQTTVDLSNVNGGLYFVQIDVNKGIISKKVIKE